jgi:hypothetical protein
MAEKLSVCCHACHKKLHYTKHFTSEDGRILCYKCRTKEKAKPATKAFKSALGVKNEH